MANDLAQMRVVLVVACRSDGAVQSPAQDACVCSSRCAMRDGAGWSRGVRQ